MKIYLAAQLFIASFVIGMSTALVSNILSPTQFTIDFINYINKLYDIFNSSKAPYLKSFRHPFKNNSEQIYNLNKIVSVFRNIKGLYKRKNTDKTKCMNFIKG